MSATLAVQGFTGHLLALNGQYQQQGDNHGKPTYKKRAEMDGTTQCCVYFWDERDGDALAGWWMAPEVGGEQVWAHCVSKSPTPPTRGWKVPWHTSTPDNRVVMELKQAGFQQTAAQQQFGAKRGFEQHAPGANKFARTQFGQQAGGHVQQGAVGQMGGYQAGAGAQMKRFPQTNPQQEARLRQQKEKNLAQLTAGVTTAETAITKITGAESKEPTFDKQRHISMAKSALASAQRCLDQHIKGATLDEAQVGPQKAKLAKLTTDLNAQEEALKVEQKAKLESLKTSFVSDLTKLIVEAEKLVEKTKDAAVLFTCEMAEHIKPEEAMEAKEKTDAEATPAAEALKKAKDLMFAKEKELRAFPAGDVATIRESVKPLNTRVTNAEKELVNVKAQATAAWRKAQVMIAKKKREEEQEKAKAERERVQKWNREVAGFSYQIGLVADDVLRSVTEGEPAHEDALQEAESKMLGLKHELQKRSEDKDCHPNSRAHITQFLRKIDANLVRVRQMLKEQSNKDQDVVRRNAVQIAAATREKQGDKSDADFFSEITAKTNKMDQAKFEKYLKTLGVECERPLFLFKDACKFVSADCTVLDKDSFFLIIANAYHSVAKATQITKELSLNSEKVGPLELGAVVQVLEGPTEVDGIIRVKITREKKGGVTEEGFVTLRASGVDNLVRYSPHYTVLSETVLTDTFDLKGFKVVRRIKQDEKFRAIGIPKYNKDSDMWRINGVTEQKENVWVTIQGNRGTSLLRNEPMSAVLKKKEGDAAEMEEFTEEKLNSILVSMAENSRTTLQKHVDDATEAVKAIGERIKELEAADEEGKEPSQEEVAELIKNLDAAFMKQKDSANSAQLQITRFIANLKNVESGPYAELKESFPKFQETLTGFIAELKELMEKRRTLQKSVQQKEMERRMAREKAEQEALSAALLLEIQPQAEAISALVARLVTLDELPQPKMTDTIAEFQTSLKQITQEVAAVKEAGEAAKKWVEEKTPLNPKGPVLTAATELKKLRGSLLNLLTKCEGWTAKLKNLQVQLKEKLRVDFAILLKNYLEKKDCGYEKLFKSLAKESETISLAAFTKFAKHICKDIESVDELVKSALGSVKELSKEHLEQLGKVSYRCLKRALVTDIIDIKSCKKLKTLEPEEIVAVVDKHVMCEKTGLTRVKGKTSDGTEGYVTIKGNKNSIYLKFQQSCYKVIKETVFTDCFEMKNFKVLRRLREGDYLRELSHPQLEEKSGLYRMKAQSVEDNEIGWVTLKGNAGSQFLVNCEMPPPKVEEPAKEEAKKE